MKLGYLLFEVRKPDAWKDFAQEMLGLSGGVENADGSRGYRLDSAAQRIIVAPGKTDDIAAIGLEFADEQALDAWARRLAAAGIKTSQGDAALCRARRVERLMMCTDPLGIRIEAVTGIQRAPDPFSSATFPGGFHSDQTGFGHVVLAGRDLEALERFYVGGVGFAITERLSARVGPLDVRGTFLHCNRRHHTLALLSVPQRKRLNHFMLQAGSAVDVIRAHDRARQRRVPFSLELGQHPPPDSTLSFYARTPSGFDFEIGAGGGEIEPQGWQELLQTTTSSWGHQPTLGLKLRAARDLLASKLGFLRV